MLTLTSAVPHHETDDTLSMLSQVGQALPSLLIVADANYLQVAREVLIELELSWEVIFAKSLRECDDILTVRSIDVALVDLGFPHVDGIEATNHFTRLYPHMPVVLMSPPACVSMALEAMQLGAVNHFPRELLDSEPQAVLNSLRQTVQHQQHRRTSQACVASQVIEMSIPSDRTVVPAIVDDLQRRMLQTAWCDRATAKRVGVALEEALLNAIIHGNLDVSSDLRQEDEAIYYRAIDAKMKQEPYGQRQVQLTATLTNDRLSFRIQDQGNGFDVTKLPDPTDPANLFRIGGRGLLLMRSFMTEVEYSHGGTVVTLVKCR